MIRAVGVFGALVWVLIVWSAAVGDRVGAGTLIAVLMGVTVASPVGGWPWKGSDDA
jgi:hypothetical protein